MAEEEGQGFEQAETATIKVNKELEQCRCLNLCELSLILADQMRLNNRRSPMATQLIKKSYEYAQKFAQITSRQAIFDLRSALEAHEFLKEFEMALFVNLVPRNAEETRAIIPTLNRLTDEQINAVLSDIEKYKLYSL